MWNFEIGDTVFCVWPNIKWVTGKGWAEAKEGYQNITHIDGELIKTDVSKGWVSKIHFTKISSKKVEPIIELEVEKISPQKSKYEENLDHKWKWMFSKPSHFKNIKYGY